ncbi:MerR family transcriptional regulator [Umezawaea sp. Da 62-37]|uniref:MerR family transcriptional regulator n=1 Tax=Umezawaea sp. Da 62-37 TaxID=3075927 RepID=UPI0028F74D02|nr:MerR family transcriptional regulator [Umezawaea sp. Da 62-37]WNV91212.1 MerR family transcriptional regulator [Umezawaea sp. Da 62-37]
MSGTVRGVRIGELTRATGASARALRFYEDRGLLRAERAANGYRRYGEEAVARVRSIRYLLGFGLTLDDIAHFGCCLDGDLVTSAPDPRLVALVERRLAAMDQRITALSRVRDHLAAGLRTTTNPT